MIYQTIQNNIITRTYKPDDFKHKRSLRVILEDRINNIVMVNYNSNLIEIDKEDANVVNQLMTAIDKIMRKNVT